MARISRVVVAALAASAVVCAQAALAPGATMTRHVAGNAPDVIPIPLPAKTFIRIRVIQDGADLIAGLRNPAGELVCEVDSGNGRYGPEAVVAIADSAGEYRLEVRTGNPKSAGGDYTVEVGDLRAAEESDAALVEAHRNYVDGNRLMPQSADKRKAGVEKLRAALAYFRGSGDVYMNGLAAYGLGNAFARGGELRPAIPLFGEAAAKFREAGSRRESADAVINRGGAFDALGDPEQALASYREALALFVSLRDRARQSVILSNIGVTEGALGEWQSAIGHYREAQRLAHELGDGGLEGHVLRNMGVAYLQAGDTDTAFTLVSQSLALLRAAGDKRLEAITLDAMANLEVRRGDPAKAIEYGAQSMALWTALGDKRQQAQSLVIQGVAYADAGRTAEAQATLSRALDLATAVEDRRWKGDALVSLARVSLDAGDSVKAAEMAGKAVEEFRAVGDRAFEARSLETLARAEKARGRLDEARRRIEESLKVSEETRRGAESQQLRAAFSATRQDAYGFYIDLLMQSKESESLAFETSERARARSLLEMLASSGTDIREGVDAKLVERERDLSNLLNAKGARLLPLLASKSPQAAALTDEIRNLEAEYQDVQAAIRKSSPKYAALTQPRVLTAEEIRNSLLDQDTVLLEYSLGEQRSYLWTISRSGLRSYELPARRAIEDQSRRLEQLLAARAADVAVEGAARELSAMVIEKAAAALAGKRLLIVADGELQRIPFSILPDRPSGEAMIAGHEIVMTPSASALAALRSQVAGRKRAPKSVAVFADPVFDASDARMRGGSAAAVQPGGEAARLLEHVAETSGSQAGTGLRIARLPFTSEEADGIARLAPRGSVLKATGFEASRATALNANLGEYRFLHFATHGYLDTERPALSALVLSQIDSEGRPVDGFVRVNDIYNARIGADLVSLSACQTGLGKDVRGEGLMGLTRAFLYAGAPRVVVSLWNVNDRATAALMTSFYERMLRRGERPSQALREAQLDLRKDKRWKSPYYWAAFVQHGDWMWEGR